MEEAKKIISVLKKFDRWDIGGSKTQVTATETEDFVADCFQQVFGEKIKIFKMGSQQHPDFMMIPSSAENSLNEFNEKVTRKKKITLAVLRDWEASKYNKSKIRVLRVEVKTGKSVYTLNDTFPKPFKNLDEIYVLFAIAKKKVYVTTSYTMAESNKTTPPITERYEESKEAVKTFHKTLKDIWEDTGISTSARPTYRMNQKYSHHEATAETIFNLFKESGLI